MQKMKPVKFTFTLAFTVLTCVVGNSFLYGYNIGVINTPQAIITKFYNETYESRRGEPLDDSMLTFLWTFTVAIFVAFGMIGSFASGKIVDAWGRKMSMIAITTLMFAASVFGGVTKVAKSPECLMISRAFVGLHNGLGISFTSLFLNEISPKKIRGAIGTCNQLLITIGILVAQIMGLEELLGTVDRWPILFALNAIPALFCLVCFPFCPESPRFLLINRKKDEEAKTALQKLLGYENVDDEMEEMRIEAKQAQSVEAFSLKKLLTTPELKLPIIIAVVLFVVQQWSGINAVFSYSRIMFVQAKVPINIIPYLIVGTGVINVIITIISVPLMECAGRRLLLLAPTIGMIVSFIFLVIFLKLGQIDDLKEQASAFAIVCIVAMHTYVIGFALGFGPIPFIIVGELFRQEPRATATSFAVAFNWICNFILMLVFPFMEKNMGPFTYLVFTAILVFAFIFIMLFVPETKNRSFDDIAKSLSFGRRSHGSHLINDAETVPMDSLKG